MNNEMRNNLKTVIDAIANEDAASAKEAFHEYLREKTQSLLLGEAGEYEEESDEDEDDEDEDDEDEDEDEDDKPAFLKKKSEKKK